MVLRPPLGRQEPRAQEGLIPLGPGHRRDGPGQRVKVGPHRRHRHHLVQRHLPNLLQSPPIQEAEQESEPLVRQSQAAPNRQPLGFEFVAPLRHPRGPRTLVIEVRVGEGDGQVEAVVAPTDEDAQVLRGVIGFAGRRQASEEGGEVGGGDLVQPLQAAVALEGAEGAAARAVGPLGILGRGPSHELVDGAIQGYTG